MTMKTQQHLTETVEGIESAGRGEHLHLADIIDRFSERGFGPLLLVPSLVTFLPTGGIPGVPVVCAALIVLIAGQLLAGKSHPWVPQRLRRLRVSRERFTRALDRARPVTRRMDRVIKPRLDFATGGLARRLVALLAIGLALALIPLGPIPFAAALPSGVLVMLSVGLIARDGLLILAGFAASAVGLALLW